MLAFIESNLVTAKAGKHVKNKRHVVDGSSAPLKFTKRPKLIEVYSDEIPNADIVNRKAHFLVVI